MAAFAQHIQFSSVLGLGYTGILWWRGVEWTHAALGGVLCGLAGMLPDLDSDSGRPTKELFGVTAVIVPLLVIHRLRQNGVTPEGAILAAAAVYVGIRFGAAWLLHHLTVHRGMFHSIPAALIAAEIVFLAHLDSDPRGRLILAGGVLVGFLSHLVLDELYSVDAHGLRVRFNKAAGSALKLASRSIPATFLTWLILGGLTYLIGVDRGYFQPLHFSLDYTPTAKGPPR
jgi:membrane-bound metal-dependent hydrolase YbcI (DUF457 family)